MGSKHTKRNIIATYWEYVFYFLCVFIVFLDKSYFRVFRDYDGAPIKKISAFPPLHNPWFPILIQNMLRWLCLLKQTFFLYPLSL